MAAIKTAIVGCGDIGRRICRQLIAQGQSADTILAFNASRQGSQLCSALGVQTQVLDLDQSQLLPTELHDSEMYYLVPPQKQGDTDRRIKHLINAMRTQSLRPGKLVLLSTTGVYGNRDGEWTSEEDTVNPQSARARRRLDLEQQCRQWSGDKEFALNVLRVPGIYARDRLPVSRLKKGTPVVKAEECGFSNRIHADDLASVAIAAMQQQVVGQTFNVSDGAPGSITEYLQEAARVLELPELPEISMQQAEQELSQGMLSYLRESKRISNKKMLRELGVALRYSDFRTGIRH